MRGPSFRQLDREDVFSPLKKEVDKKVIEVLNQPFYSWTRGSQSEVFLSRDRCWTLKIPRDKRLRSHLLGRFWNRKRKDEPCLKSYCIAESALCDEAGVLYVNRGNLMQEIPSFDLYDRLQRRLPIDPKCLPFALQEKVPLFTDVLKKENIQGKKNALLKLLDLMESEYQKGWFCDDCAFALNFGFMNGKAVRIDIGSYAELNGKFSWERTLKPITSYLLKHEDRSLCNWWLQEIEKRQY